MGWTRKAISFAMASVMVILLAACAGNNDADKNGSANGKGSASPSADMVTLKIEIFDRGNTPPGGEPPDNNNWTRYIQQNFGDPNHIKVEFVTVPRSEEVSKLNILMAADEAPDLVFTYDRNAVYNYVSSGGLTDLNQALGEYAPDLKKFLGDEVLAYGQFDGKQYAIPAKRTVLAVRNSYIRKDWLDKLNMDVPTTRDELYQVLKAFKEKDPGQTSGKVVPYSVTLTSLVVNGQFALHAFDSMTKEEMYTLPDMMKPGYKESVRFFNKLYNEGLMSPNFAIDKDSAFMSQEIVNGQAGFFEDIPDMLKPSGRYSKLKENVPTAELALADPYENNEGKHPKWLYDPIGAYHMIPKSSEHVKEALMYLNWLTQPDVLFTLQNGIEGTHYKLNKDGLPLPIINDETKKTFYNTSDITMILNGKEFGSPEKNIKAQALTFEFPELGEAAMKQGYVDGYHLPLFEEPIESEGKNFQALQQKQSEVLVKAITAKPDQFDGIYDQGLKEYMAAGGQTVMDEKKAAFAKMNS